MRPERRRRPTRLPGHDYAAPGWYVITVCVQDRAELFGEVAEDSVCLNAAGLMVDRWWSAIPRRFPGVALDEHVVMPNHLHGIVIIQDPLDIALAAQDEDDGAVRHERVGKEVIVAEQGSVSLTQAVGWFKTMTTNEYIRGVKEQSWEQFNKRLWQRSFYDSMIRSDRHLERVRAYIEANPLKWSYDEENPQRR